MTPGVAAALTIAASCLAGTSCGGDPEPGAATAGRAPAHGGTDRRDSHVADGGGTPGPAAATSAPAPSALSAPRAAEGGAAGLELRADPVDGDVSEGDPVLVRLRLVNSGGSPIEFHDLERDIASRLVLRCRWGNQHHTLTSGVPPASGGAPAAPTVVAPGAAVEFEIDVLPLLSRTQGYGTGSLTFDLVYEGNGSIAPAGSAAWNAVPGRRVVSEPLRIDVAPPAWAVAAGTDGDICAGVADAMLRWTPGAGADAAVEQRTAGLGAPGHAALALLATRLEAGGPRPDARSTNALRMLRRLGAPVTQSLGGAPARPSLDMLRALLADDRRAGLRGPQDDAAPAAPFRSIASGTQDGTTFAIVLRGRGGSGSPAAEAEVQIDGAGAVWLRSRAAPGASEPRVVRRAATPAELASVKGAILAAKPWTWRPMRAEPRPAEGEVTFSLLRTGTVLWMLALRGDEAFEGNPFAADLCAALRPLLAEAGVAEVTAHAPAIGSPPERGR